MIGIRNHWFTRETVQRLIGLDSRTVKRDREDLYQNLSWDGQND